MQRNITYLTLLLGLFAGSAHAQLSNKVSFGGAGRFLLDQGRIDGELLETDTTTARRELNGLALFDFGITIRPNEDTEIKAVTRVENAIDGFWGAGITFQLRELTARGVAGEVVRYAIGDIDAALTPYTLWNSSSEFRLMRNPAFEVFRDIVDYENYYADSTWRQQGLEAEWKLDFDRGIESLTFHGLVSKNRNTDYFTLPDRLLGFARVQAVINPALTLQVQGINLFEIAESAQFNEAERAHRAGSILASTGASSSSMNWRLDVETGLSSVRYANLDEAPEQPTEDFFVDGTARLQWPEQNLQASLSYRDVGPDYRAPGAQSRRLDPNASAAAFSFYTNRETQRPVSIADVVRDRTLYNRTIAPELSNFNPSWENAQPYGQATPNRRGVHAGLNWTGDSARRMEWRGEASFLTEIRGEGTEALRRFLTLEAAGVVHLARYARWEKALDLHAGLRNQQTTRSGTQGVDDVSLGSLQAEIGLQWEIYPRLDVLGGMLFLQSSGNEYVADRDDFNRIVFYDAYDADLRETWISGGLRYRFTDNMVLSAQYFYLDRLNNLDPTTAYTLQQAVVLYNLFF